MRTRKSILVFIFMLMAIGFLLHYAWNFYKANEQIRDFVVQELRQSLVADFKIANLEMSLGAVHLKGVEFSYPAFRLQIADVRIGYGLRNLFRTDFKSFQITNDILLKEPVLTLNRQWLDAFASTDDTRQVINLEELSVLTAIQRLSVANASIFVTDRFDSTHLFGTNIEGWINATDFNSAVVKLVGQFSASGEQNLQLDARGDIQTGFLEQFQVLLQNVNLAGMPPELWPESIVRVKGRFNAQFSYLANTDVGYHGAVDFEDGYLAMQDSLIEFSDAFGRATYENKILTIENAEALHLGAQVALHGTIVELFTPEFDLELSSENISIAELVNHLPGDRRINGQGTAEAAVLVKGSIDSLIVMGDVTARQIEIDQIPIDELNLRLQFIEDTLQVTNFELKSDPHNFRGNGILTLGGTAPTLDFRIKSYGSLKAVLDHYSLTPNSAGNFTADMNVSGSIDSLSAAGRFSGTYQDPAGQWQTMADSVFLENQNLRLKSLNVQGQTIRANGVISNLTRQPNFDLDIHNLQQLFADGLKRWPIPVAELSSKTHLSSSSRRLHIAFSLQTVADEALLRLNAILAESDVGKWLVGDVHFNPESAHALNGHFELALNPDFIRIQKMEFQNGIKLYGTIPADTAGSMELSLNFDNSDLVPLAGIIFPDLAPVLKGRLEGAVDISGTRSSPVAKGAVDLIDTNIRNVGTYTGKLAFSLEKQLFFLKQAVFRRNKQEIINASGFWNIDTEQVQLSLLTHDLNLNYLSQMFGKSPDAIRGAAFCEVYISNTLQTPDVKGELQILDGGLGKIPFDSLGITLGNGLDFSEGMDSSSKLASKSLNITNFSLIQSDKLAFSGSGLVPLDGSEELKLSVVGSGDVLSLLELLAPKIEKATGVGELSFVFGGPSGAMKFQAGELRLNNGQLRVPPVLPDIDNIDCRVKLDPETQFLKIEHLTADFDGEPAVVGNSLKWPGQRPRPARVRPFFDDRLGLIFGHFTVQTNEKGISLYIPGLMKLGDRGWISGTGISPGEPLIVGGPVRHPYVTGRAELRDLSFSIPFYEVAIDTSKVVYKFLTRAEYDAFIIPRSDTRYVREIAHVPDILEVDVVLTEKQGLHLSGSVADKSIQIEGGLEANRGVVEYLNLDFRIEQAGVRFDKSSVIPEVYGRARTSLSDSTGASYNLYLTLYTTDPNTGEKRATGRLNEPNMYFELSSDNPNLGMSEGQILSNLGVSPENIRLKAPDLIGMSADNLFLVPIFRPVERTLERFLGLDYVKVRPVVARNILERNMRPETNMEYSRYYLFNNSRISLGKYVSEHWFLSYTGELKSLPLYQPYAPTFGLRHQFGLEYLILPNLLFEMEYDYNSMLLNNKSDKRFMLRHSFPF